MASNMQRQSVPLIKPEIPIVGTGFETKVARDSRRAIISKQTGKVVFVSPQKISVQHKRKKNLTVDYKLRNYERTNQDTCINEKPLVHQGDFILKGDLLADSSSTLHGELALGKNILVAYMPWNGLNFEDAIVISDRLVSDQSYTHINIEKYDVQILQTEFGSEEIIVKSPKNLLRQQTNLDNRGIIKVGSWVESGDILIQKRTPIKEEILSPSQRLLLAIFSKGDKKTELKRKTNSIDSSLKVPENIKGRVIGISISKDKRSIRIYLAQMKSIQIGDKMSGRHGNKGIISKIVPKQDMPFLPDGTTVDIILSPLGVPSRMNVGQILECLLGLAGRKLYQNYRIIPFDEMYGKEASRGFIYKQLYKAKMKTNQNWIFNPNFPGKTYLIDGQTGESFDQPILTGYSYMLKLIHLVDKKIHARCTGPYSLVTQQPLRGRMNKGGQRVGEMEVWALEGFGAAYTLQEMLTIKSDDMINRNVTYHTLVLGKPTLPIWNIPESSRVLIQELQALCLDIQLLPESQSIWKPITPTYH
jgi:DNA-directed RNA polymerase subunit beta